MSESISERLNSLSNNRDSAQLRKVLETILVDITALATAVDVLAAKLNADATVTDTNYAKVNAAAITTKA